VRVILLVLGERGENPVADKFEFRYGTLLSLEYKFSKSIQDNTTVIDEEVISKNTNYTPGIIGTLGFHYVLNNVINVSVEFIFLAGYDIGKRTNMTGRNLEEASINGFVFNTGNVASLVITCKF